MDRSLYYAAIAVIGVFSLLSRLPHGTLPQKQGKKPKPTPRYTGYWRAKFGQRGP